MENDSKRLLLIVAILVSVIGLYLLVNLYLEATRPRLIGARVVSACDSDPVFRDGVRHLAPDEQVRLAVALQIDGSGDEPYWLAPVDRLVLDGRPVEHVQADQWPEKDRFARVFWFTIECSHLGGELTAENAASWLAYRSFLAPKMGQELTASPDWTARNADFLDSQAEAAEIEGGTLRFYARVEVVDAEHRVQALQAVSSLGADQLLNPALPVLSRRARLATSAGQLHNEVGELFLLPGFEPQGEIPEARDLVPMAGLRLRFYQLVEYRIATSSRSLAAMAVTGQSRLDEQQLQPLGQLHRVGPQLQRGGRPLSWATELRAGDLLRSGSHWLVLLEDDGNGLLDEADQVLHCWLDPPAQQPLREAMELQETSFDLLRHVTTGP